MKILILILSLVVLSYSAINPTDIGTEWKEQSCATSDLDYFWDGQKCEVCQSNCYCDSYRGCKSCKPGYGLVGSECKECDKKDGVSDCCFKEKTVVRATKCLDTLTQFYKLYGNYCYTVANCQNYSDYGKCTTCQSGYYLNASAQCETCSCTAKDAVSAQNPSVAQLKCLKCDGPSACSQWYTLAAITDASFTLSDYCVVCGQNCKCTKSNRCESCIDYDNVQKQAYYKTGDDTNAKCVACSTKFCTKCTDKGCEQGTCLPGYVFKAGTAPALNTCEKCENCYTCKYDANAVVCNSDSCYNGYFFKDNKCIQCTGQASGVARCDKATGAIPLQCKEATTALSRAPHKGTFYLVTLENGTKECQANENNCKKMKHEGTKFVCESCYEDLLWYLLKVPKTCAYCLDVHPACQKCDNNAEGTALICKQCVTGRASETYKTPLENYVNLDNTCKKCSDGCLRCSTEAKCEECQISYRLNNGSCEVCAEDQCASCSKSAQECDKCMSGFTLWYSTDKKIIKCEQCEPNCKVCKSGNRSQCTECKSGYTVSGGYCKSIKSTAGNQCAIYSSGENCQVCQYGFRLVDGWCHSSKDLGYINTGYGCDSSKRYNRDGDSLTASFEDKKNSSKSYSSILIIQIISLILGLSMII